MSPIQLVSTILLTPFITVVAFSQSIDIQRQTRAPQPTPATAQVWVYVPGVGNWPATIDTGLALTGTFPNFKLTAPAGSTPPGPTFVDAVVPTGALDGTNAVFTLPSPPSPTSSLQVFRNGVLQKAGAQFTLSGSVVTFNVNWIPMPGDDLLASYRR